MHADSLARSAERERAYEARSRQVSELLMVDALKETDDRSDGRHPEAEGRKDLIQVPASKPSTRMRSFRSLRSLRMTGARGSLAQRHAAYRRTKRMPRARPASTVNPVGRVS